MATDSLKNGSENVYLGIDTATPFLALALWSPSRGVLERVSERVEREHAKRLPGELDGLFKRVGVSREALRGIGVGLGPGSYTGLRIGIATAEGLARGLGVPLRGLPSLEAMAAGVLAGNEVGEAVVALDARRGNVYAGVFSVVGKRVRTVAPIEKVNRETLRARYPEHPSFEGIAPDAGYLARCARSSRATPIVPLYL